MLSIVIADDESGMVDLCKMLIDYPHATVIGEANNGLELLEKIKTLHPNTVITDISMPGMTGLELIEAAQGVCPDVNFIVISGYTDFEYVQKALRFGVWDYLLKPLKKKELNSVLRKLDEHLNTVSARTQSEKAAQDDLKESISVLWERYLTDIWGSMTAEAVPVVGTRPVWEFSGMAAQVFLFCVDWRFSLSGMDAPTLNHQAGSFFHLITSALSERQAALSLCAFPVELGTEQGLLALYPLPEAVGAEALLTRNIRESLRAFNIQNSHVRMSCGASLTVPAGPEALPVLFSQSRSAARCRLENRTDHLIMYHGETAAALEKTDPFTQEAALRQAVEAQDEAGVLKCLETDWNHLPAVPGISYRLMEQQLACINQTLLRLPEADRLWDGPQISSLRVLSGGGTAAAEFPARIAAGVQRAFSEYRAFFRTRENSVVTRAKQYVAQHYAEDISLNQIARLVCLSPAYFSTLFKAETGSNFIKYLQRVRIEQAKTLLKTTKLRIGDIAVAVGYRDLKFFNKIFLSETTVTPSEYRKFYS